MKANELAKIKEFVNAEPQHKLQLALEMGYSTTSAIDQWFVRKSIPRFLKKRALEFIERKDR